MTAPTTYSQLQSAITTHTERSDLSTLAPDFIRYAENHLNRVLRLQNLIQDATLTGTEDSREVARPTSGIRDVEPLGLWLTTFGNHIFLTPKAQVAFDYETTSGTPGAWAIDGANIVLDRPCDQAHTFRYRYRDEFQLADTDPNYLLTNYPDAYLAASLVEAFSYIRNFDMAGFWEMRRDKIVQQIRTLESQATGIGRLAVDSGLLGRRTFDINTGE